MSWPTGPAGTVHRLLRGVDRAKDQAYFLYGLRQDQLARARFPLGELREGRGPRRSPGAMGLATADKPESMEICFVPERRRPRGAPRCGPAGRPAPGPAMDATDGRVIGEHAGAAAFTVGQRRGVGVAVGRAALREPRSTRRPTRSPSPGASRPRDALVRDRGRDLRRGSAAARAAAFRAARAGPPPRDARARRRSDAGTAGRGAAAAGPSTTDDPVWAAAPGQACVLYDADEPDVVLGGGRIARPGRRRR